MYREQLIIRLDAAEYQARSPLRAAPMGHLRWRKHWTGLQAVTVFVSMVYACNRARIQPFVQMRNVITAVEVVVDEDFPLQ